MSLFANRDYVTVAPLAGAYVDRVPRRTLLVSLDVVRTMVVLALPVVSAVVLQVLPSGPPFSATERAQLCLRAASTAS